MQPTGPRNPEGSQRRRTNRLAHSSSPYLLQHAHNPVDWWEWGPEAFEAARRDDKPIFLSVGYSTCYWCHVMERQVFEDERIAAVMNDWFVCVKVDREQRPDVDELYMAATQLTTGHGGWPNSVFLTPDLKPFYTGTYFGPTDQFGRPGFPRVLAALHDAWTQQRADVAAQSDEVAQAVRQILGERLAGAGARGVDLSLVEGAVHAFKDQYDSRDGGFGTAPKFPQGFIYPFLADVARRTADGSLVGMITHSLQQMAGGGIYDQVGGGFHRYATDARWLVPHFEKMLYDQAQLAQAYVAAFTLSGNDVFRIVGEDVLAFVGREMTNDEGGFHSAIDAETDATEGKFYLWSEDELRSALAGAELELFRDVVALVELPEIPGHEPPTGGVVTLRAPLDALAHGRGMSAPQLAAALAPLRAKLLAARGRRPRPLLDDKSLASWNGMMIQATADAGRAFGRTDLVERAARAAAFALGAFRRPDGGLWRVWRGGAGEVAGFSEDTFALARGLTALHRATGERRWLNEAIALVDDADARFRDPDAGGYFLAEPDPLLFARVKSPWDGAIPSANSIAAHALLDLYELTGDERRLVRADEVMRLFAPSLAHGPTALAHMAHAVERRLAVPAGQARLRGDFMDRRGGAGALGGARAASDAVDSGSRVRVEAFASETAMAPGRALRVAVRLTIDRGWHIHANPAAQRAFAPTVVDVRSDIPTEAYEVRYPRGTTMSPAGAGEPVNVYEGVCVVVATITPSRDWTPPTDAGAKITLRVAYSFQACSGDACLAPARGVLTLGVPVSLAVSEIRPTHSEVFAGLDA